MDKYFCKHCYNFFSEKTLSELVMNNEKLVAERCPFCNHQFTTIEVEDAIKFAIRKAYIGD